MQSGLEIVSNTGGEGVARAEVVEVEVEDENGSVDVSTVVDDVSTPYFSLRAPSRALASQIVPEGVLPEGITSRSPTAEESERTETGREGRSSTNRHARVEKAVTVRTRAALLRYERPPFVASSDYRNMRG